MGNLTVNIDDDLETSFRKELSKRYNYEKGSMKKAVEEAIRLWIRER